MRHTGGSELGDTSTKSRVDSRALAKASSMVSIPTCSPFGPITRTSEAAISSLRLTRLDWTILDSLIPLQKHGRSVRLEALEVH